MCVCTSPRVVNDTMPPEGYGDGSRRIGKFCGEHMAVYWSSGLYLYIHFVSDSVTQYKGFSLAYQAVATHPPATPSPGRIGGRESGEERGEREGNRKRESVCVCERERERERGRGDKQRERERE